MLNNFISTMRYFYEENILGYLQTLYQYPVKLITLIIDIAIVVFLLTKLLQVAKNTRVWQLVKGIFFLLVATALSGALNLRILNYILNSFTTYGVIILIIIFQPELRRGLEQLGTSKFTRFFGLNKDLETKTKENIYKIVLAAQELSNNKVGGLIVIERDINISDIVSTGITMDSEISPQLLVNIFSPTTPLHDGAVIIKNNKISAAACMLPLADDRDISKELGTRHRAALGIAKESDAVVVIISEETRKISIAKDGTLIIDVKEEALKKILIKSIIKTNSEGREKRIAKFREKIEKKKQEKETKKNEINKEKEQK